MTPTDRDLAHACEDYQRTYRRQQLARQAAATAVPIPDGILEEGAQRFLSTNTSRKAFLAGGAGLAIALSGLRLGRPDPRRIFEAAAADAAKAGPHPILVLIYQSGGNDGLNTLVPLTGGDRTIYEQQRTRIGLAPGDGLLPLGGPHASADFAWNPACAGLQTLYDAGQLAVLPAIDYPEPNLSHFHSAHFWRSGVPDFSQTTGWLGRYLDVVGATSSNPLQGVAVQWGTDEVLLSRRAPTCALYDPRSFDLSTDGVWRDPNTGQGDPVSVAAGLARLARHRGTSHAIRHSARIAGQVDTLRRRLRPLSAGGDPPKPTALGYPSDDGLSATLSNLRRMLSANLGIRVATLEADGGWDSHQNQKQDQAGNLTLLGGCLAAWQAELAAHGLANRVVTVVWSEFGRRVEDNDSQGTDHGAGGLMLVSGATVQGGLIHDPRRTAAPGWNLGQFASDRWQGNVPVGIDYRDVYAGLLQHHLGVAPRRVLTARYRGTPLRVTV